MRVLFFLSSIICLTMNAGRKIWHRLLNFIPKATWHYQENLPKRTRICNINSTKHWNILSNISKFLMQSFNVVPLVKYYLISDEQVDITNCLPSSEFAVVEQVWYYWYRTGILRVEWAARLCWGGHAATPEVATAVIFLPCTSEMRG